MALLKMGKNKMNLNRVLNDTNPISTKRYKYVFWQSILLIIMLTGAYTSIGLAQNLWILLLGVVLFGLSLYLIEKFKLNIFEVKPIKRTHLLYMLCATLIGLVIYWSISLIIGQPHNQLEVYQDLKYLPIMISIIIFVILGPIFEELIFRMLIMKGIFRGHLLVGYIVSSVLFGLIHGPLNVGEFLIYCGLGLVFGAIYILTKRFELSILCHSFNNLLHILIFILFYN